MSKNHANDTASIRDDPEQKCGSQSPERYFGATVVMGFCDVVRLFGARQC
jgi:hypothetical protein